MTIKYPRVGVVVIKDGKLLFGRRKGAHGAGDWSFAGGHLEYGENIEDCATRELAEETGLKALSLKQGPWVNDVIEDKHYVTIFIFVDDFVGELQLLEPHKCEGWQWFEGDSLPEPLFAPIVSLMKKIDLKNLMQFSNSESRLV